jgi:regulator of sirC expression with transglutaminase-like and TPR domain
MGFRGNVQNYYDPGNSYLNVVLERRTGIPISLCAVAMAVGTRAGLTVQGVGLPGHFIAKAIDGERELLFDPFHGGRRLWQRDCENLVRQVTQTSFEATPDNLRPLPLGLMVQRMLNNLKAIYLGESDFSRGARVIARLRQLEPDNPLHHRDLGACFVHLSEPGKAITHLQTYLEGAPAAVDEMDVKKLLQQARREIARWN